MFHMTLMAFVAFPNKNDAILQPAIKSGLKISVEASGSLGVHYDGKCHKTYPNQTLIVDEKLDWCSNIADNKKDEKPWIMYSIKGKGMKVTGFSVRNGCCWYPCCCIDDDHMVDYACCCRLDSFSLQGSNDNKTWKTIHHEEKDKIYYDCQFKTYNFPETESFTYIRFVLDKEYPDCPRCMQINQIELYGRTTDSMFMDNDEESDESVSIIGKVKSYN